MSYKKEGILVLCLLSTPIILERLGIVSGNWHQDAHDLLLLIIAVSSVSAMVGVDQLREELRKIKVEEKPQ